MTDVPLKRKLTIEDVARQAGVSISTVSRVMNNTDYIADATRKKWNKPLRRSTTAPMHSHAV